MFKIREVVNKVWVVEFDSYHNLAMTFLKQDVDFLDKYGEIFKRIEFSRNYLTKDSQILADSVGPSEDPRKLIGITNFINLINEGYVELVLGATDIRNNKLKELL